ncbi:acyltransferase [Pseudomonas sp. LFM046]|uniref:acyltransferase n=1 Tax=Pseudomonas sp. LFM046 TaxID=1608357 RepID=UPI0009E229E0|nr:acyltransferase [Pseudomonas sp. LFM046]
MNKILVWFVSRLLSFLASSYWKINYWVYRQRYDVHHRFRFNGRLIQLYGEGKIVAGEGSYIGELSTIQASKGAVVSIGCGCHVSHNVRIYTQSALPDSDFSIKPVPSKVGDVKIGDYCWVGANVLINPGVEIGRNSVVGANSVVTKDVPPDEIWGGVPAKFIRKKNYSS